MKINYFPDSAPRYPNLWIFVSKNIAKGYENAYRFDDAAQRRGLQYVRIGDNDEESHDHALHFINSACLIWDLCLYEMNTIILWQQAFTMRLTGRGNFILILINAHIAAVQENMKNTIKKNTITVIQNLKTYTYMIRWDLRLHYVECLRQVLKNVDQ